MKELPYIGLFCSGEKKYGKGGDGISEILEYFGAMNIKEKISVIVSDNWNGGVRQKAYDGGICFHYISSFPEIGKDGTFSEKDKNSIKKIYQDIIYEYDLEYIFLSDWLKYIIGLVPNKTVNIHLGPLKQPYIGNGINGINIHNKVWEDYVDGKINQTCVTMNYIIENINDGPIIAQIPVCILGCNSPEDVKKRVNDIKRVIQGKIIEMVMNGDIYWSGVKGEPVIFPEGFSWGKELDLMEGIPYSKMNFFSKRIRL